jgi:hypothetical protein
LSTNWRHRWYKVFPMEDLFGSIRYRLTPAERGVWYDLRSQAGISAVPGTVCESRSRAYPSAYLANLLNVQTALLETTVKKAITLGLCTQDKEGIHIPNWQERQSEYDRQKPYREAKRKERVFTTGLEDNAGDNESEEV